MSRPRARLWLFFSSGATSLVYQTVWARELHLVVGTSSFAISTVLAAFMGGLGIGGALAARGADRVDRPLRAYGLLEAGIGVYALILPLLIAWIATPAYLAIARVIEPGPLVFGGLQAALVGCVLLPPTAAMGATLPLLARLFVQRKGDAGDRIGLLYGANTAGAVVGTAVAGLVLLPGIGLRWTTWLTALGNLSLAALAVWLDRRAPAGAAQPLDDLDRDLIDGAVSPDVASLAVIALAGAASLICEVAWTRLVGLVLGGTTYAFTAMLLAVLIGIALGGRLAGPLADTAWRRGGTRGVLIVLAQVQIAFAGVTWGLTFLWAELPYWFVWLYDGLSGSVWAGAPFAAALVLCVAILLPPAALMGAAFPLAVRAAAGDGATIGRPVALAYAANTLGGVVGAAAAGFVLLPWLTLRGTVAVAVTANLIAAAIALWRGARRGQALLASAAVVVPALVWAPWDPLWMSGGMHHYVSQFDQHSREGIRWFATGGQELLFYREGLSTVVTVGRNTQTGNRWLANNGKVDASTGADMPTQVLSGQLPVRLAADPADVLVVGLASGITAGAVLREPGVQRLTVVELEPAVIEASRYFDDASGAPLDDPRTQLLLDDARAVLARTDRAWDVIVSEPSNPWITGVSSLFTLEYWRLVRRRLAPDGIVCQWIQLYGMGPEELRGLLRTFLEVFPDAVLVETIEGSDVLLIGGTGGDWPPGLAPAPLLSHAALARVAGEGWLNTDDRPRVEWAAPRWLHYDTGPINAAALRGEAR